MNPLGKFTVIEQWHKNGMRRKVLRSDGTTALVTFEEYLNGLPPFVMLAIPFLPWEGNMATLATDIQKAFRLGTLAIELAELVSEWRTLSHMTQENWEAIQAIAKNILEERDK